MQIHIHKYRISVHKVIDLHLDTVRCRRTIHQYADSVWRCVDAAATTTTTVVVAAAAVGVERMGSKPSGVYRQK